MFGVVSAPAIWRRFIEQLLSGIPGVAVFLDDIMITVETDEELRKVGVYETVHRILWISNRQSGHP